MTDTLARRPTTALAKPSRRGFLKALGALTAATAASAVLGQAAKVAWAVECVSGPTVVRLKDGTEVTVNAWVHDAQAYTQTELENAKMAYAFHQGLWNRVVR